MANRKAEFLNIIKPILDRSQAKKDALDLAVELQDILGKVKVGLDESGLKEFEEVFNEEIAKLGMSPITLSNISIGDNTLKDIAKQIAGVVSKVIGNEISKGVKNGVDDALAAIAELEKSKAPYVEQRKELMKKKTRLSSTISAREDKDNTHPHPMAKDGDINEQARKVYQEFQDAKKALVGLYEDTSVSDADYQKAEDRFYQSIDNLYRMRQTMKDHMEEVTDKGIKKKFKFDNLNFSVDEAFSEVGLPSLEDSDSKLAEYEGKIEAIDKKLASIDIRIKEIKDNNKEIIDKESVDAALKSLEEVDDVLDRIRNKTKKKEFNKKKLNDIKSAIEYDPSAENNTNILSTLQRGLNAARQNGAGWEEEYQWIVKFVKQYKYLEESGQLSDHLKDKYEPLFNELVGMSENAERSLVKLVDRAEGRIQTDNVEDGKNDLNNKKESVAAAGELVDAKKDEADAAAKLAAEEEKARKDAEARAKAEKEATEAKIEAEKKTRLTDNFDKEHKSNVDMGSTIETAARINLKTGDIDNFVVGQTPHHSDIKVNPSDNMKFGNPTKEFGTIHSHASRAAAPSIDISGKGSGDLDSMYDVSGTHPIHIIRSMEEELWLDFSKITEDQFKKLIDNYKSNAKAITDKFYSVPESQRDGEWFESYQAELKAAFLKAIKDIPDGFATWINKPMFEDQKSTVDLGLNKAKRSSVFKPEDVVDTDDVKTLQKYIEEYRRLVSLGTNISTSDKKVKGLLAEKIAERFTKEEDSDAIYEALDDDSYNTELIAKAASEKNINLLNKEKEVNEQSADALKEKLKLINQIFAAYQKQFDAEDKYDNSEGKAQEKAEEAFERAKEAVEDFEREYHSVVVTMQDGSKVNIPLDDDFAEAAEDILKDASRIQNIDFVPRSAESAINAYDTIGKKIDYISKRWRDLETLERSVDSWRPGEIDLQKNVLESAIKSIQENDPDFKYGSKEQYDHALKIIEKLNTASQRKGLTNEFNESLDELRNKDNISWTDGMDDAYAEVLKGIREGTFTTVNECVAKFKELADVVDVKPKEADLLKQETEAVKEHTDATAKLNDEKKETVDLAEKLDAASKHGTHGQSIADAGGVVSSEESFDGSPNMQELKNVLGAITYNVKIVNDDADNTANKIALDDSSLEAILNKVFANILNPPTEQNDGDGKEPWALESTLQDVKGVLDRIQTNTSKISTSEVTTVADDGVLTDIKQAVESINKKIVQGTKVITVGDKKDAEKKDDKPDIKNAEKDGYVKATKVDKRVKDLQALYEKQGRLEAQLEQDGNDAKVKIDLLQTEEDIIDLKKTGIVIDEQELAKLKEKAKQREADLLIAEKANEARKQAAKDEKADLKARLKRSKEENRFGASTTAWNSGNKALESLWKIDAKDKPLEQKSVKDLMAALKELNTVRQRVNENLRKGIEISEADSAELAEKTKKVAMHTEAVKQLTKNYDDLSGSNAKETGSIFGGGDLETQLRDVAKEITYGKAKIGDFDAATGRLKYTVQTGKYEFEEYEMAVREAGGAIVSLHKGTKRTETFFESFKRKLGELTRYFSASSLIYKFFNEFRKGIQYIRDIDAALVELRKVTDKTEEEYDQFLNTASKTAGRLGSTISAVTEATATFAKLGYEMGMAAEMAEAAIVYKNVGDNIASTEDAANSIISTLKGFNLEASESMRIVDRFNEVGNKFAITSQGIGEALRLSASALNEGGNTLDESIGLITAANEVVNDPSSVGTALKTLTLRLRGSKTELEEMGEDVSDMATTTSQLQAKLLALTGGQVDIMLDENTFKSSAQILREMAAAWESMTDIQRASALELMGGKRQANVLSALIQNFDTAEKAIETSANSAGSALRENEVWLDSIEGKITQFTGALQTMWKNTLDSDVVKGIVNLGTEIVKIIDKVGLLNSALLAFGAYKGFGALFKSLKADGVTLKSVWKWINQLTLATRQQQIADAAAAGTTLSRSNAEKFLNLSIVKRLTTEQIDAKVKEANRVREIALVGAKQALALAEEQYAEGLIDDIALQAAKNAVDAASVPINTVQLTMTQALGMAFKGLAASIWGATKAVIAFLFTNPVGWVILAIGAIAGGIAIFNHFHKTTEELTEELNDLKYELQDIQSELDSLNSELETTQDRMAELLAMDTLSFTEKEELDNLKKENDELQRKIDLLNLEKKQKQQQTSNKFVKTMESAINKDTYNYQGKRDFWDKFADALDTEHSSTIMSGSEYMDYLMAEYEKDPSNTKYSKKITKLIGKWTDAADGLDYGINDETDKWLDYVYNLEDKYAILSGGDNAKTNAINRIFNKDEFAASSKEIDKLVEQLEKDPTNQTIISKISEQCKLAEEDLKAVGLSVEEATEYFTSFASDSNFNTLAGKTEELKRASNTFENLLRGSKFKIDVDGKSVDTGLAELFDEEGKVIQTKLSQIFNNTSEQTRKDITSILESSYDQIKDGLNDAEITNLLTNAGIRFSRAILEIEKSNLISTNLELFPGLEDEIKGIIDTFDELISSVGSVVDAMDTLDQARAEEAYSGSVSLETLGQLMESTDNYADLIEIDETGAIKLATNAQEILVQQKINAIKTNADLALKEAELALQEAIHAEQTYTQTGPAQDFLRKMTMEVGGAVAFVSSLWNDIISGNWDGAWDRAKAAQKASISDNKSKYAEEAAGASVAVEEARKNIANAEKMKKIADGLTSENIKSRYDSDEASGGNGTVKDVENDRFQKAMDYWENRIGANQAKYEQIQNEIDLLEAKGMRAGEEYYREQIELENQRKSLLEQQKAEALKYLGTLKEGSDEWWEVANTINNIESELDDVIASVQELNDAIGQIRWDGFEQLHDRFSNLTTDLENIRDILSNEDMFDDEGNFTKEGVANLATYIQELEIYKNALADVQEELADFQQGYEGNEEYFASIGIDSEQEYYDKLTELTDKQDEYTKVIKDSEQSVVEMYENQIDAIEEYIGELIDGYNDYIDVVKESLDAERDLYEFKKNVQKQNKDISQLERRIAALSGSTNASDVAERRKLEAELYEAKEGLNDTYYQHSKDQQSQALDDEAQAYEESMNKYVEGLRTMLEEAQKDMETFLSSITNVVVQNAGSVEEVFDDTGLAVDSAIVDPWTKAAEAMAGYEEDSLDRMNDWTKAGESGYFYNFNVDATNQLKSPWSAGTTAANTFVTNVKTAMGEVYKSVQSNVDNSVSKLSSLTSVIQDTNARADNTTTNKTTTTKPVKITDSNGGSINTDTERLQAILNKFFGAKLAIDGSYGPATTAAVKKMQKTIGDTQDGLYTAVTYAKLKSYFANLGGSVSSWFNETGVYIPGGIKKRNLLGHGSTTVHLNAKGTLGTKKDGWNITDESWIGEEITLAAGKNGQLQYLKKGSAVMPADISANLVEWGKLNPNMLNVGGGANINMINNAINKPEINLDIAEFLHVDKVDKDTMPELEKFVDKKMNELVRQLNYSIKKFK